MHIIVFGSNFCCKLLHWLLLKKFANFETETYQMEYHFHNNILAKLYICFVVIEKYQPKLIPIRSQYNLEIHRIPELIKHS
jgi:hypothetical protein